MKEAPPMFVPAALWHAFCIAFHIEPRHFLCTMPSGVTSAQLRPRRRISFAAPAILPSAKRRWAKVSMSAARRRAIILVESMLYAEMATAPDMGRATEVLRRTRRKLHSQKREQMRRMRHIYARQHFSRRCALISHVMRPDIPLISASAVRARATGENSPRRCFR